MTAGGDAATDRPQPSPSDAATSAAPTVEATPPADLPVDGAIVEAVRDAQTAADDLLLHLHLATAASYGPTAVIDAAMADVAVRADALAAADAACRATGGTKLAAALGDAGPRLAGTIEAIEASSQRLALELARRRADIDEVLRQAAGSPGIYDASGRTSPGATRRPRGAG